MDINWYPGHMAKSKRLLMDQLSRVDVVVELCDARIPFSSRNPDLGQLVSGKRRVLLLNKADLAEPGITRAWVRHFREEGLDAAPFEASRGRSGQGINLISQAAQEAVQKALARGVRKTVKAMVVGVPNVGKSTFVNALHGGVIARTGDRPGVTRSNQWVKITPYLELLDTPGLMWPRLDNQIAARRLCYVGSIKDQVVDIPMLTIRLLKELMALKPAQTMARFKFQDPELTGEALLEAICRGRGFLLKGGVPDVDRCCAVVLDEFRAGAIGPISPGTAAPAYSRWAGG